MVVTEHLNVSAESFFDRIVASIAYEASQAKGKTVDVSKICTGYSYTKTISRGKGKTFETKVKLTDITRPTSYSAKLTSTQGVNTMSYRIQTTEPGRIDVTYEETFVENNPDHGFGSKLLGSLSEKRGEKRARQLLHQIEQCAIDADRIDAMNADDDEPEVELDSKSKPIAEAGAPTPDDEG
jgi:hypothetical protein